MLLQISTVLESLNEKLFLPVEQSPFSIVVLLCTALICINIHMNLLYVCSLCNIFTSFKIQIKKIAILELFCKVLEKLRYACVCAK